MLAATELIGYTESIKKQMEVLGKRLICSGCGCFAEIADVLDVNVSELLGADINKEDTATQHEIATQLYRINEQLAI